MQRHTLLAFFLVLASFSFFLEAFSRFLRVASLRLASCRAPRHRSTSTCTSARVLVC